MKESLKRQKLKTGIFSGSFNPVHIGHLALANYLCEYEGLDEIWFMVSPQNPLKAGTELWPDDLRLRLVELATEEYPPLPLFRLRVSSAPPLHTAYIRWKSYMKPIRNGTST